MKQQKSSNATKLIKDYDILCDRLETAAETASKRSMSYTECSSRKKCANLKTGLEDYIQKASCRGKGSSRKRKRPENTQARLYPQKRRRRLKQGGILAFKKKRTNRAEKSDKETKEDSVEQNPKAGPENNGSAHRMAEWRVRGADYGSNINGRYM